jgi:glycosyltransferase involved in cell wall biosynthesis
VATDRALVSAIVLCYNQARFVVETLQSVQRQTYPHLQLIVMDDASADDSARVIREWTSANVPSAQVVAHTKNQGVCRTLNEALALATGTYVAALAADDLWFPDKISRQVEILEREPADVAVVYSDALLMDQDGQPLPGRFIARHRQFSVLPQGDVLAALSEGNFIPALTPLIRRSAIDAVGQYDESLSYEDWDMWLRLAARFRFAVDTEPTGAYRIVPSSLSHQLFGTADNKPRHIRDRFHILEKCTGVARLDPAARERVVNEMGFLAGKVYENGAPERNAILWKALRRRASARQVLMFAMSAARLPYSWFHKLDELHTARSRRAVPQPGSNRNGDE